MVDALQTLTRQVTAGEWLGREQVRDAVEALVNEEVPAPLKADFLTALARRGETPEEIAAFADELRGRAIVPPLDPGWRRDRVILDVVGTGGDQTGTFNISTAAALICAAAGVYVAKHGNRAVTSRAGSADVLEALGIPIQLEPTRAVRMLQWHQFAFFFAPMYHPAFRHIAPARRLCAERGQRTLFNYLGPLLNPVRPDAQLMGVPRPDLCVPLASVLEMLGVQRGLVVCGQVPQAAGEAVYVDELTPWAPATVAAFGKGVAVRAETWERPPRQMRRATLEDIRGGDARGNAEVIEAILQGRERGPKRQAAVHNAAAALCAAGTVTSLEEGWSLAEQVLEDGRAARKLEELRLAASEA